MRYVHREAEDLDGMEFLSANGFPCVRVGDGLAFGSKEDLLEAKRKYPQCFSPCKPVIDLYDALQGDIEVVYESES